MAGTLVTGCGGQAGATAGVRVTGDDVVVPVDGGEAVVRLRSLAVSARARDGQELTLSGPAAADLGRVDGVSRENGAVRWTYPDRGLSVTAAAEDGRLAVTVRSSRDGSLVWPVTGTDPATTSVAFPRGEGLSVPVADPFWNSPEARLSGAEFDLVGGLTMPFWGHTIGGRGVSYIAPTDIDTKLRFVSDGGRLRTEASHVFAERANTRDYTVTFALTEATPVAAAEDYRKWLVSHNGLSRLRDKIERNPEVGRLVGAFHAYVWGQARTPEGIRKLRETGVDRMWIGYDADAAGMGAEAVRAARDAGYLVGPYDSWANAQDPATADTRASVWPGSLWKDGCVRDAAGKIVAGFHDRGCYLSSQALAQAEPAAHVLADRVKAMTAAGANSYFLDVDAAGELFDDHDGAHPMNRAQDRRNRLDRMRWLSEDRKLVLGSESAGGWANPVLAFSHGSATPVNDGLWPAERNREEWGRYYPQERPGFFFKPTSLPAPVAKAMFDPVYRVPLYQTVLHDSVISLDRWELPYYKLPELTTTRALLAMLHNTPLNFVLDGKEIDAHGRRIAALQRFFAPLHNAAATEPMTGFRWVTSDHLVQQTTFGDGVLTVTANFGSQTVGDLPGGCVEATLRGDHAPRRLCPGSL
nr:hypothetical protein GCM10020241_19930 [Streptoalloteichus tenebrarius]